MLLTTTGTCILGDCCTFVLAAAGMVVGILPAARWQPHPRGTEAYLHFLLSLRGPLNPAPLFSWPCFSMEPDECPGRNVSSSDPTVVCPGYCTPVQVEEVKVPFSVELYPDWTVLHGSIQPGNTKISDAGDLFAQPRLPWAVASSKRERLNR